MEYYFSKTLKISFDDAVEKTIESLKGEGFGIVSEIDIDKKLKEKLGVDFKRYKILGACNPQFAHLALQAEDKIGAMLPCNILVIEQGLDNVEVAAVNPAASMQAVTNQALAGIAITVTGTLKRVIEML